MSAEPKQENPIKPLRAWIPAILLALMVFCRFVPGLVEDGPAGMWMIASFGPMLGGVGIVLWWLLLSRATILERIGGLVGIIAVITGVVLMLHKSMLGAPVIVMTIPLGLGGFALGAILLSRSLSISRTALALLVCFAAAGFTALQQNFGVWGDFAFDTAWRWEQTPEEAFLAEKAAAQQATTAAEDDASDFPAVDWPGFRGPKRDGVSAGTQISADWTASPPKELWRIKVGPAWSSFAIAGSYLFTQEQRGESEAVVCYDANTGAEIWSHDTESRFFEALGGLGPRATPTLDGESLFTLGAEGWLSKINARTGELVWQKDLRVEADKTIPMWGFSSSPLVYGDVVVVHAGGAGDKGVLAFKTEDGSLAWSSPAGEMSYSSLQTVEVEGTTLLAILSDLGAHFFDPTSGETLLDYKWKHSGYRALQAQVINGNQVLIPTGMGSGTRLIEVSEKDGQLAAEELWTSRKVKPDFNDLLVHKGFLYGFDDAIFTCIDLADGEKKWKAGRYGKGQAILMADSDLIAVLSEKGKLVLLKANPEEHEELFEIQAMDGRTWNHPTIVGNRLYIRNAEEAVCYEMPTVETESADSADQVAAQE